MSRTTFPGSFPEPTATGFTSSFKDSKKDFNRARNAITAAQKIGIGIGVTIAVLAIISVVALVIMIMRKNRRRRQQMEQNEKMYEHHRVDPSPDVNVAVYGSNGGNGYEMAAKSELSGVGVVGEQYGGQVYVTAGGGRAEMGDTTTGELNGGRERRELGGQEVRGELGAENGVVRGGHEKVSEKRVDPIELQ